MHINLDVSKLSTLLADVQKFANDIEAAIATDGPGGAKVTVAEWLKLGGDATKIGADLAKAGSV